MDGDDILLRLYSLLPELEAEGNFLLARSTREVIAIVEHTRWRDGLSESGSRGSH